MLYINIFHELMMFYTLLECSIFLDILVISLVQNIYIIMECVQLSFPILFICYTAYYNILHYSAYTLLYEKCRYVYCKISCIYFYYRQCNASQSLDFGIKMFI